jgi:pre-rRNA-processing protein TSR2
LNFYCDSDCDSDIDFFQCFCTDPLYIDDLETLLDEGVLAFNLQIEDGSVEEVVIFS